ncbi:lipopolysaccharide biosynthesis protein [Tunicatimonas pelagia]|uniref:lipopolysaccharide biosynthesis protein n=1 Tax=Tunicatimonas pelagia TaxID=931531 RepID=UPI002665A11B|nr:lipopolysaccharide biosynthesis protein [Tunicatimonas pelagia]WKN44638.1 lipopolysaccharide biosynthesis protein [Tunicatimonas pelagia]
MKVSSKKIASGVGWVAVSSLGNQGLRLVVKLVLARLLLPEHYGLIGMAVVFTNFIKMISEFGMGAALIQRKEEELTEDHYITAFWTNIGVALVGYAITALVLSPVAVWFYDEPVLSSLLPVIAISIVLDALYLIPKVKLSRQLEFRSQAIINIVAVVIAGGVSIYLAFVGWGVWALAFNSIIVSVISGILYFLQVRWVPPISFNKPAFMGLFSFGGYVLIERIFYFLTNNIDYLLIGKLIGSKALGVYTLSFILTDTFRTKVMNIFNKVLFPAYSSMQSDGKELKKYYLGVVHLNANILIPIMVIFIALAKPIILVGFGEEWLGAVNPLRILSLSVIIHAISGTVSTVIKSTGRADLIVKINALLTLLVTVPAITLGSIWFGIVGAAWGVVIYKTIGLLVYQHYIQKIIGVPFIELLGKVFKPALASALAGTIAYLWSVSTDLDGLVVLIAGGFFIVALYGIYLKIFEKQLINKLTAMVKRKK